MFDWLAIVKNSIDPMFIGVPYPPLATALVSFPRVDPAPLFTLLNAPNTCALPVD